MKDKKNELNYLLIVGNFIMLGVFICCTIYSIMFGLFMLGAISCIAVLIVVNQIKGLFVDIEINKLEDRIEGLEKCKKLKS